MTNFEYTGSSDAWPGRGKNRGENMEDNVENKQYDTETENPIDISWKEIRPSDETEKENDGKAVVFLPGWGMQPDARSIQKLVNAFAEQSQSVTYAVTSRAEKETDDSLYNQSLAISRFIKERGLKEITLAGYSQGGDKAIDVVTILQQDPDIKIKGLVLLDSVGLYEQNPAKLTAGFIKDTVVDTPLMLARDKSDKSFAQAKQVFKSMGSVGTDIMMGLAKDIWESKAAFLTEGRLLAQARQMAKINPRMAELRTPVILISGSNDPVSNPRKIMPPGSEKQETALNIEHSLNPEKFAYIDPREEYLKKQLFPNSPHVRMVVPEKLGQHGLPLLRSESVARASLYLLNRFERNDKQDS